MHIFILVLLVFTVLINQKKFLYLRISAAINLFYSSKVHTDSDCQ